MQKPTSINRTLLDNLIWFAGSVVLAFFVWVIATLQSNPIQQEPYSSVTVRLSPDAGLLITSPAQTNRLARVVIRAPRSVLDLLTREEIEIWADLTGLGPGEHAVELQYRLLRQQASLVDISPSRMRVTLEEAAQRQIALRAVVTSEPPPGYTYDSPTFDVNLNQVLVSGAASKVNEVVAAQVELDLRQQRNPYEVDMRLSAVDADGNAVTDVTLDPQVARVRVNIRRRDDVREVTVRPNIEGTPPDGYVLSTLSYEPQTVLISGSPLQLASLPEILSTDSIDLSTRTASFEIAVPVLLPDSNLLLLSAQNVTVTVEISTVTGSRQFDAVPVEILGLPEAYMARLVPAQVSVLVTGPQTQLNELTADDIRVVLDLNGLSPGNYSLTPTISVDQGQIAPEMASVLPGEVDVEILENNTPEATSPVDE
ncbi:MAG: hypothetical protein K8L97_26180 [Anaerolineae bacterium]|nr:hypothetical protein [Anaerolineae bacterium]